MRDDDGASDPLDALIDDTARGMTASAPPASLRETVAERTAAPHSPVTMRTWQTAIGVACGVLIVAAFWFSQTESMEPAASPASAPVRQAILVAPPATTTAPAANEAPVGVRPRQVRPSAAQGVPAGADLQPDAAASSFDVPPLAVSELSLTPLSVEALAVAPLPQ